jgi:hypothetical protein
MSCKWLSSSIQRSWSWCSALGIAVGALVAEVTIEVANGDDIIVKNTCIDGIGMLLEEKGVAWVELEQARHATRCLQGLARLESAELQRIGLRGTCGLTIDEYVQSGQPKVWAQTGVIGCTLISH